MYWRVSCNALLPFDWTTSEVVVSSANFHISAGDVSHFQKSKTGNGLTWARNYWMANEFKWLKWRNTRHYEYNVKVIKQIKVDLPATASLLTNFRIRRLNYKKFIPQDSEYLQAIFISAVHLRYYFWIHNQSVVPLQRLRPWQTMATAQ